MKFSQLPLVLLLATIVFYSCNSKQPHPDYVEISGKITNAKSKMVSIYGVGDTKKEIPILENGTFKDTFKVNSIGRKFQLLLGEDKVITSIMAENGSDIRLEADASDFGNTAKFYLDFADYNNYQNVKTNILASPAIGFNRKTWYRLDKNTFDTKLNTLIDSLATTLGSYKKLTEQQLKAEKAFITRYKKGIDDNYEKEHEFAAKLSKGSVSPIFENYENYNGSKTSLTDFKGKYVFIDIWATWCVPCRAEIPHLEALQDTYKNDNIVFVSLSVDKQADKDKWRNMIKNKHMSGVQILAPNETASNFTKAYNVTAIPRFILIDPAGNIVDFDAPRPSNKEAIHKLLEPVKN